MVAAIARKIHGREMLAMPHVRWLAATESLPAGGLVLCDHAVESSSEDQMGHRIQMLIGRDIDPSCPVMPYPMHPATLAHADVSQLVGLRARFKRGGILFAGNQKPKYGDAKMQRNFGVLSRLDVLRTLSEVFPSRVVQSISHDGPSDQITLSDSRTESISPSQWLPTLARSSFFLCCPGACQPTCHHLVEAMSVGTIPILEYADRVTPNLVDGKTAICFRGKSGLMSAIERIDRMPDHRLLQMRANVASFYDQHLCGTTFLRKLRDAPPESRSDRVCMPFHDRNFYDSETSLGRAA